MKTGTENTHRHKDSRKLWTTFTEAHAHDVDMTGYATKEALATEAQQRTAFDTALNDAINALTVRVAALEQAQKYQGAIPP